MALGGALSTTGTMERFDVRCREWDAPLTCISVVNNRLDDASI
jgi:hypothetical protein